MKEVRFGTLELFTVFYFLGEQFVKMTDTVSASPTMFKDVTLHYDDYVLVEA